MRKKKAGSFLSCGGISAVVLSLLGWPPSSSRLSPKVLRPLVHRFPHAYAVCWGSHTLSRGGTLKRCYSGISESSPFLKAQNWKGPDPDLDLCSRPLNTIFFYRCKEKKWSDVLSRAIASNVFHVFQEAILGSWGKTFSPSLWENTTHQGVSSNPWPLGTSVDI